MRNEEGFMNRGRPWLGLLAIGAVGFSLCLYGASAGERERELSKPAPAGDGPQAAASDVRSLRAPHAKKLNADARSLSAVQESKAGVRADGTTVPRPVPTGRLQPGWGEIAPEYADWGGITGDPRAACSIQNLQGGLARGDLNIFTTDSVTLIYVDPAQTPPFDADVPGSGPGCGVPAPYPFFVETVDVPTWADCGMFGATACSDTCNNNFTGTLSYKIAIWCADVSAEGTCAELPTPGCATPNSNTPQWESAEFSFDVNDPPEGDHPQMGIVVNQCLTAPFFVGIHVTNWTGASPGCAPSLVWDNWEIPDCIQYISIDNGASFTDWTTEYSGFTGFVDTVVHGDTNNACSPGICPGPACGDGTCDYALGENCDTCPADCTCVCGDGTCGASNAVPAGDNPDLVENCMTCSTDCGDCFCGDEGSGTCCGAHDPSTACCDPVCCAAVCGMFVMPECCIPVSGGGTGWTQACAEATLQTTGCNCEGVCGDGTCTPVNEDCWKCPEDCTDCPTMGVQCPADNLFGQDPDGTTAGTSDVLGGFLIYENLPGVHPPGTPVCDFHWWGINYIYDGSWHSCAKDPESMDVVFYPDLNGEPDYANPLCSYLATTPAKVDSGDLFNDAPIWEFSFALDPCCNITDWAWVSVLGLDNGEDDCWSMWVSSDSGWNGAAAQADYPDGTGATPTDYDVGLCLTPSGAGICGNGIQETGEFCDPGDPPKVPADDAACPGECNAFCQCPPPPITDCLETSLVIKLEVDDPFFPGGFAGNINLIGDTLVERDREPYEVPLIIDTEILSMDLSGSDPQLGDLTIGLNGCSPSTGMIKNVTADVDGNLTGGDSSFEVWINLGAANMPPNTRIFTKQPVVMRADITELPPVGVTYQWPDSDGLKEFKRYDEREIPDADAEGLRSEIVVNEAGAIADLNVGLLIAHPSRMDLDITLTHKASGNSVLISHWPSGAALNANIGNPATGDMVILDDQSANGAFDAVVGANPVGDYTPANPLAVFNGVDKKGTWSLTVVDKNAGNVGALQKWSLQFQNATAPPIELHVELGAGCGALTQLPNQGVSGISDGNCDILCSEEPFVQVEADNFVVTDARSISSIQWWGGYENINGNTTPFTDNFTIVFRLDDGFGNPTLDPPLNIHTNVVPVRVGPTGNAFETVQGELLDEYEYTYELPTNKVLAKGIYWLEIYNNSPNGKIWRWEAGNFDCVNGIVDAAFAVELPEESWLSTPRENAFILTYTGTCENTTVGRILWVDHLVEQVCSCKDVELTAPFTDVGDTCGMGDDCSGTGGSEDAIYTIVIPNDGYWTFSLCGTDPEWDSYLRLGTGVSASCCLTGEVAENDDGCGTTFLSEIITWVTAGTYWLSIEGFAAEDCGAYTLDVSKAPPCDKPCPGGYALEGEPPCGPEYDDLFNGGCNAVSPAFSAINCGDQICGATGVFPFGATTYRDTDWYQLVVTEPTKNLTWTVEGEFPLLAFVIDGTAGCDGTVLDSQTAGPCEELVITTTVGPGTYWLMVTTLDWPEEVVCGALYNMSLDCVQLESKACPEDSLFGQLPTAPSGDWVAGTSDAAATLIRYENFKAFPDPICDIHFWGLDLEFDETLGWIECLEDPMTFDIKFYLDAGGVPGAEFCSYTVNASPNQTALLYGGFTLNSYDVVLNPCCKLPVGGWVSIQGVSVGTPDCYFLWMSSDTGNDGASCMDDGTGVACGVVDDSDFDLSLCLTPGGSGCEFDEDCYDGDQCTVDTCDAGACNSAYSARIYADVTPFGGAAPPCSDEDRANMGDGFANMLDVFCIFNGFNAGFPYAPCPCGDISPCAGDNFVNMLDVFAAFNTFGTPGSVCPDPCP